MNKDELTTWALANGWQMVGDAPALMKPRAPNEAIVRMVMKATVVNLEVKKPSGKWEKVAGASYGDITYDDYAELPRGLGLDKITGLTQLMQDNKDRLAFAKLSGKS